MAGPRCAHLRISGRVQAVGFRYHARARARELGVHGWVRNLADGRVEALLEGPEEAVEAMIAWLRVGPPGARVGAVEIEAAEAQGAADFSIR